MKKIHAVFTLIMVALLVLNYSVSVNNTDTYFLSTHIQGSNNIFYGNKQIKLNSLEEKTVFGNEYEYN